MSDDGWHEATHWDQNPVIELGNAWITFGDVLYEQAEAMDSAQFDLINGGWLGTASTSMTVAFHNQSDGSDAVGNYGLHPNVVQAAIDSWNMGEAINYFAMLRNEQQATEAKEALASLIATLLGLGLSILASVLGEILGLVASLISRLVATLIEVGGIVGEAVASLAGFAARIGTWVDEASAAAAAAYPWSTKIAGIAYDITKFGVEFTSISALATLGGNAAAGLPTDWKHWSPVPTTAEGWAEFIEMGIVLAPIQAIAAVGLKGLINKAKPVPGDGVLNIPRSQTPGGGVPNVSVTGGRSGTPTGGPKSTGSATSDIVAPNTRVTGSGPPVVNSKTFADPTTVLRPGPTRTGIGTGRSTADDSPVTPDAGFRTGGPTGARSEPVGTPAPRPRQLDTRTNQPVPKVADRAVQQPGQGPGGRPVNTVGPVPPQPRSGPLPQRTTSGPEPVVRPASGPQTRPDPSPTGDPNPVVTMPPPRASHGPTGTNLDVTPRRPTPHGDGHPTGAPAEVTAGRRPSGDEVHTGAGPDTVRTAPPQDVVRTGPGAEAVRTAPPADNVRTGPTADVIGTGHGTDATTTAPPADAVRTGPGTEGVRTAPGADAIRSGPGTEAARTAPPADAVRTGPNGDTARTGSRPDGVTTAPPAEAVRTAPAGDVARTGGRGADTVTTAPGAVRGGPGVEQGGSRPAGGNGNHAGGGAPVTAEPKVTGVSAATAAEKTAAAAAKDVRDAKAHLTTKEHGLTAAERADTAARAAAGGDRPGAGADAGAPGDPATARPGSGEIAARYDRLFAARNDDAAHAATVSPAVRNAAEQVRLERSGVDSWTTAVGQARSAEHRAFADSVAAQAKAHAPTEAPKAPPKADTVTAGGTEPPAGTVKSDPHTTPADGRTEPPAGSSEPERQPTSATDPRTAPETARTGDRTSPATDVVRPDPRTTHAGSRSGTSAEPAEPPARRGAEPVAKPDQRAEVKAAQAHAAAALGDLRDSRVALSQSVARLGRAEADHADAMSGVPGRGRDADPSAAQRDEQASRPSSEDIAASYDALRKARDNSPTPTSPKATAAAEQARLHHAEVATWTTAVGHARQAEHRAFADSVSAQAKADTTREAANTAAKNHGELKTKGTATPDALQKSANTAKTTLDTAEAAKTAATTAHNTATRAAHDLRDAKTALTDALNRQQKADTAHTQAITDATTTDRDDTPPRDPDPARPSSEDIAATYDALRKARDNSPTPTSPKATAAAEQARLHHAEVATWTTAVGHARQAEHRAFADSVSAQAKADTTREAANTAAKNHGELKTKGTATPDALQKSAHTAKTTLDTAEAAKTAATTAHNTATRAAHDLRDAKTALTDALNRQQKADTAHTQAITDATTTDRDDTPPRDPDPARPSSEDIAASYDALRKARDNSPTPTSPKATAAAEQARLHHAEVATWTTAVGHARQAEHRAFADSVSAQAKADTTREAANTAAKNHGELKTKGTATPDALQKSANTAKTTLDTAEAAKTAATTAHNTATRAAHDLRDAKTALTDALNRQQKADTAHTQAITDATTTDRDDTPPPRDPVAPSDPARPRPGRDAVADRHEPPATSGEAQGTGHTALERAAVDTWVTALGQTRGAEPSAFWHSVSAQARAGSARAVGDAAAEKSGSLGKAADDAEAAARAKLFAAADEGTPESVDAARAAQAAADASAKAARDAATRASTAVAAAKAAEQQAKTAGTEAARAAGDVRDAKVALAGALGALEKAEAGGRAAEAGRAGAPADPPPKAGAAAQGKRFATLNDLPKDPGPAPAPTGSPRTPDRPGSGGQGQGTATARREPARGSQTATEKPRQGPGKPPEKPGFPGPGQRLGRPGDTPQDAPAGTGDFPGSGHRLGTEPTAAKALAAKGLGKVKALTDAKGPGQQAGAERFPGEGHRLGRPKDAETGTAAPTNGGAINAGTGSTRFPGVGRRLGDDPVDTPATGGEPRGGAANPGRFTGPGHRLDAPAAEPARTDTAPAGAGPAAAQAPSAFKGEGDRLGGELSGVAAGTRPARSGTTPSVEEARRALADAKAAEERAHQGAVAARVPAKAPREAAEAATKAAAAARKAATEAAAKAKKLSATDTPKTPKPATNQAQPKPTDAGTTDTPKTPDAATTQAQPKPTDTGTTNTPKTPDPATTQAQPKPTDADSTPAANTPDAGAIARVKAEQSARAADEAEAQAAAAVEAAAPTAAVVRAADEAAAKAATGVRAAQAALARAQQNASPSSAEPRPAEGSARPPQPEAAHAADAPPAGAEVPVARPAVAAARVARIAETAQREAAARAALEARSPEVAATGRAVADARAEVADAERNVTAKVAAERQAFARAVAAKAKEGSGKAANELKGVAQNKAFLSGKTAAEAAPGHPQDPATPQATAATAGRTEARPHEPATVETGVPDGDAKTGTGKPQDPVAPPAAGPRSPDLSGVPRFVSRTQLATREQASPFLPSSEQAVLVGGMYRVATNRMYLDGAWRDAAGVAEWIRKRTAWDPDAPVPVVLVAGQAGRGHLWAGLPSFGMQVAQALGGEVIAPVGHPVDIDGTDLLAGTPEPHGEGVVLHVSDEDGWVGFNPGRTDARLGPDLGAALEAHGIALLPPEQVSDTPTIWSFGPEAPKRTAVYAPVSAPRTNTPPPTTTPPTNTPPPTTTPRTNTPPTETAPRATPADPGPLPTGPVMSRLRAPGPASRPATPVTPVRPVPPAPGAPVTPLPPRTTVAFGEGSKQLGDAQQAEVTALAQQVARSGLLAMRARIPLPAVTITGYGNGTWHPPGGGDRGEDATTTGTQRAQAVEEAFRRALDQHLTRLQDEAEAPAGDGASEASSMVIQEYLTADSFTITTASGGRDVDGGPTGGAGGSGVAGTGDGTGPRAARRQAVIGIAESPHADAAARLAVLAQADPQLGGVFDADSLVYGILHLDWSQDPDESHYRELYTLVEQAAAEGRATSTAALGAYHLVQLGALSDEFRITAPDGTRLGLNWSEDPVGDLDTTSYDVRTTVATSRPAGWSPRPDGPRPYLVVAEGTSTGVRVGTAGGARRTARSGEVAALLAMDRELSARGDGVPVLMLVPQAAGGGLEVPRAVATATGRVVWAHSGHVSMTPAPQGGRTRLVVKDLRGLGIPMGTWIASEPGFEAPDPLGTTQTLDDGPIADGELTSFPLAVDGRQIGRSVFSDADQAARELLDLHDLPGQTRSYRYDSVTGEYLPGWEPMPWAGRDVYYFVLHGEPGRMALQDGRRQVKASGEQVGGYLKRRPSLRRLAPDVPIALVSCWADTPGDGAPDLNEASRAPFVADPLRTVSGAQSVANVTGRTVFAPDRTHFFGREPGGPKTVQMIADTALNEPGAWHEVRPEPLDDALDALARTAGLRPAGDDPAAAAGARAAVLRLVRALRQTFGVTVEDDAGDPAGGYRRLLRGIGALEAMRRADPDLRDEGPFTRDLLDRAARAHRDLRSGTPAPRDRAPTADDVRAMLEAAAAHLAAAPGAALRDFVALPSVDRALDLLRTGDRAARAAEVLRTVAAGQQADPSDADRSRLLWAAVKAVEAVEGAADADVLAAKVLHLGGGPADPARRTELLWLVAAAAAAGVDPDNPGALAAYHLVRGGALSARTLMRGAGGRAVGRNWTVPGAAGPAWNPVVGAVEDDGYVRSADGTTAAGDRRAAPWRDPKAATGPEPYVVVVTQGAGGHVDLRWHDGSTLAVPYDEIAELLLLDSRLGLRSAQAKIVLVGSQDPALPSALSDRAATARTVTASTRPTALARDTADGTYRIVLTTADPQAPDADDWHDVRPRPAGPAVSGVTPERPPVAQGSAPPATGAWFHPPQEPGEAPGSPGSAASPGSDDSLDMMLDWEDRNAARDADDEATAAHHHAILVDLYGSGIATHRLYPVLREAVARLDTLRRAESEPALREGPLDVDAVTRRVLLLGPGEPVTGAQRSELLRVATDEKVRDAAGLPALAAFHLTLRGALSRTRTLGGPDGGLRGRNWTGSDLGALDPSTVAVSAPGPGGGMGVGDTGPAQWGRPGDPAPYTVVASGGHDHVEVRGFKDTRFKVPGDVFAELLLLDPALAALPADVPVLLLVPGAGARGLDLPRTAAGRTGRPVWSASGPVRVARRQPAGPLVPSLVARPGARRGDWVVSLPGDRPEGAGPQDAAPWESQALTQPIVVDGRPIGRSLFSDAEAPAMEPFLRHAAEATELWHENRAAGTWSKDPHPVPWAGRPVYVLALHSLPGRSHLPLDGGTLKIARGTETGGFLKRRPSLSRLSDEHVIVMEGCWYGSAADGDVVTGDGVRDPFVADPLATVSDAQHTANETGRTVFGSTRTTGIVQLPAPYDRHVHVLRTDAQGRPGQWLEYRPEPSGTALDDVARGAGLHDGDAPADPAVRERALRLVRALRRAFGPGIDQDESYPALLAGIGALEEMRAGDPLLGGATPFTMDLFDRAALAGRGTGTGAPTAGDYSALLARAAAAAEQAPGTALTDFVPLPHLAAAAQKAAALSDSEAAGILRLDHRPDLGAPAVGPRERARVFWATAKALEWESRTSDPDALGASILHLAQPDPGRRADLLDVLARAAAAGRDLADPVAVAAFHLELLGAFSPQTRLADAQGRAAGRNWFSGAPLDGPVSTAGVVTAQRSPAGGFTAAGAAPAPWAGPGRRAPYVLWSQADPDRFLLRLPGGATVSATYDEVGELLSHDPELAGRPLDGDVVLAVAHAGPGQVPAGGGPRAVSGRTGRTVWSSPDMARLVRGSAAGPFAVTSLRTGPGPHPATAPWVPVHRRDAAQAGPGTGASSVTFAPHPGERRPPPAHPLGTPLAPVPENATAPTPKPVAVIPDLETHRPPRLDRDLPPPATAPGPVRFSDGTRLPVHMGGIGAALPGLPADVAQRSFSFGDGDPVLRGTDLVVDEVERELASLPVAPRAGGATGTGLLTDLRHQLRTAPRTFFGDGRAFAYVDTKGRARMLTVTARPYQEWDRFAFGFGNPTKIDTMRRGTTTTGRTAVNSTTVALAPTVLLGPAKNAFNVWGRILARKTWNKRVEYPMPNQTSNQVETRTTDGSHAHLDDVYYTFAVTDGEGRPLDGNGRPVPRGGTRMRPAAFGFAMRHGVSARLPDSAVREQPASAREGFPQRMDLGATANHRFFSTEGYGPVSHIRDWATAQVEAEPGSSAHAQLDAFFSTGNFEENAGLLAAGQVTTPALFADSSGMDPLGVFSVKVESGEAVLIDATKAAEIRDIVLTTLRNERVNTKGTGLDVGGTVGPAFQLFGLDTGTFDLRLLLGFSIRYGTSKSRSALSGGSGTIRSAAQAKGDPTGLYLVRKTVHVTAPPDTRAPGPEPVLPRPPDAPPNKLRKNPPATWSSPPRTAAFQTWSVERMTKSEARRLATGTGPAKQQGAEPAAPPYLTQDDPATLGMSRVEEFTFADGTYARPAGAGHRTMLEDLSDQVLRELARAYPELVAPLDQLNPANPRWRGSSHFQLVQSNTLEVLNTLSHHSMAGNLETMMTTGLPIGLVDSRRATRAMRTVRLYAKLTGRRYEGTQKDERLRFGAPGVESLGGRQGAGRGVDGGIEGVASIRDEAVDDIRAPLHAGTGSIGARFGARQDRGSGYGPSASHDPLSISTKGSHLYSYELSITARRGGFRRLRGLLRGVLFLNILGTQPFVLPEPESDLIGPHAGGGPAKGRVLLSVPVEHTPAAAPSTAPGAGNAPAATTAATTGGGGAAPGAGGTAPAGRTTTGSTVSPAERPHPLHGVVLPTTRRRARDLARSAPAALEQAGRRAPAEFQRHPALTVVVVSHPGITRAVEEVLHESSGGSWHLSFPGAPAHDSALRAFQPPYLTANFDQSSAPTGWRTAGLWSKGPFLNRNASLVHRTAVRPGSLKAITGSVPVDTESTIGGSTQVSGTSGHTSSVFFGGQLVYLHSHGIGPGITGNYAVVLSPYAAAYSRTLTVSRTATAEINRKDLGRQVLIHGDVDHEFAADSSAVGESALVKRIAPARLAGAAGRRLLVAKGWVAHVPEKSAYRLGLLTDPWGAGIPLYRAKKWSPMPWLLDAPFGSYPVNSLNTAGVLADFDRKLAPLGLNEADRDTVHRAVGSRLVRALAKEMNGTGSTLPARVGKWGSQSLDFWLADRPARVRVQLVPQPAGGTRGEGDRTGFGGLGHSVELEEHRQAAESAQDGRQRTTGPSIGWSVLESVHTGNDSAKAAGPSYTEVGSSRKARSEYQVEGSVKIATTTTTQMHGEYTTGYRLQITLEVGDAPPRPAPADGQSSTALTAPGTGRSWHDRASAWQDGWKKARGKRRVVAAEGEVGALVEYLPLSLMRPEPDAPTAPPAAPDPLAPPVLGPVGPPRRVPVPAVMGPGGWLDTLHPGSGEVKPFTLPAEGYKPRSVIGRERLHQANNIAVAAGYDLSFPQDGPIDDRLARRAADTPLTRTGSGPAQVLEDGANSTALIAFHPWSLDSGGYRLPGLVHTGKFGGASADLGMYSRPEFTRAQLLTVADGVKHESPRRSTRGGAAAVSRSGGQESALGGGPTLASEPTGSNQSGTGTGDQFSDAEQVRAGGDGLASVNIKPNTARTFLFAVPTTYLSLAAVHHDVRDSAVGRGLRGTFGLAGRSPQALETDTVVLTWIREDVARELGLINDTGFPPKVSAAWDAVTKADKALTDADKRYWDARRGTGARVTADRDAARAAAGALGDASDAVGARAAADRLARELRDAEPEHDGWSELLRAQYEEAARVARLLTERDAAQARFDAFDTELAALRAAAETAAADLHRVRTETDRLTRWHQLAATPEGRRRLGGTPEPPEVVLGPAAPPKPITPPAPKPADTPAADTAAGVRPAHAEAPWQPGEGRPGRQYDPGADHRVLSATDPDGTAYTYDLVTPTADGNGFYAAVQLARGRQDDGRRLAGVVSRSTRVPDDVPLDPRAVFHPGELASVLGAGFAKAAGPELARSGGRLPDAAAARLTRAQRRALVRLGLRTARRWDAATARTAAALTADVLGVGLTVVAENGSHEYFAGGGSGTGGPQLTVYERGGQYLAARPRGPVPAPPPVLPGEPDFPDTPGSSPDSTPPRTPPLLPAVPAAPGSTGFPGSRALLGGPPPPARPAPSAAGGTPGAATGGGLPGAGYRDGDGRPGESGPREDRYPASGYGDGIGFHDSGPQDEFGFPSSQDIPLRDEFGFPGTQDTAHRDEFGSPGSQNTPYRDQFRSPGTRPRDAFGLQDDGEAVRAATTAPGAKLSVPGTGECLLYSLLASDPAHVRSTLPDLATTDPAAHAWLADPDAVRVELWRQAALRRRDGGLPTGPAPAVVEAMRAYVADQLRDGELDPEVLGQYRQWAAGPQLARRLARMDRAELLDLLAHHGVTHETLESIDADDLRRRYEAAVGPDTGNLAPRRHFAALRRLGLLRTPADLSDGELRVLATAAYPTSLAPLDDAELQVVLDAVVNWEQSWQNPVGEIFLPLLAHTFDVLVDVVHDDGFRSVTGSSGAARRIEVHYDSAHQHYDGSDADPRDLRPTAGRSAPRRMPRHGQPLRRTEDPLAHRRRPPASPGRPDQQFASGADGADGRPQAQRQAAPATVPGPTASGPVASGSSASRSVASGSSASGSAGIPAGSRSAYSDGHLPVAHGSPPPPRVPQQLPYGSKLLDSNLDPVPRTEPRFAQGPEPAPPQRSAPVAGGVPPAWLDAEPAVGTASVDDQGHPTPGGRHASRRKG